MLQNVAIQRRCTQMYQQRIVILSQVKYKNNPIIKKISCSILLKGHRAILDIQCFPCCGVIDYNFYTSEFISSISRAMTTSRLDSIMHDSSRTVAMNDSCTNRRFVRANVTKVTSINFNGVVTGHS